jgi:hypothetical protein
MRSLGSANFDCKKKIFCQAARRNLRSLIRLSGEPLGLLSLLLRNLPLFSAVLYHRGRRGDGKISPAERRMTKGDAGEKQNDSSANFQPQTARLRGLHLLLTTRAGDRGARQRGIDPHLLTAVAAFEFGRPPRGPWARPDGISAQAAGWLAAHGFSYRASAREWPVHPPRLPFIGRGRQAKISLRRPGGSNKSLALFD